MLFLIFALILLATGATLLVLADSGLRAFHAFDELQRMRVALLPKPVVVPALRPLVAARTGTVPVNARVRAARRAAA